MMHSTMHSIIHSILSAREILAGVEEREESLEHGELTHAILTATQSVCNIERTVHHIAEQRTVAGKTEELIDHLNKAEVDYTLLLYLQVDAARSKGFVCYLLGVCEQLGVPYKSRFFLDAVWAHFKRHGVQPLTPTKFIVARKKDDIREEYKLIKSRNDWGQHNPFFFQTFITTKGTAGFQKLVFFITRTWRDGAIRILEIFKEGSFTHGSKYYEAHGAFEHFVDDDSLTALILDSEIPSSATTKSIADLTEEILRFPRIIGTEMIIKGLINEEDLLHVTVKDKTRPRGGYSKVSYHFIMRVVAPKAHQKLVIEQCMGDRKEAIDDGLRHMKAHGTLPADAPLETSWYAFDAKAAISNGFSVAFSLKDRADPHSRKHSDCIVCAGMQISETLCPVKVQDLCGDLADAERLMLLQQQFYTAPDRYMLGYAKEFTAQLSVSSEVIFCFGDLF